MTHIKKVADKALIPRPGLLCRNTAEFLSI